MHCLSVCLSVMGCIAQNRRMKSGVVGTRTNAHDTEFGSREFYYFLNDRICSFGQLLKPEITNLHRCIRTVTIISAVGAGGLRQLGCSTNFREAAASELWTRATSAESTAAECFGCYGYAEQRFVLIWTRTSLITVA